jgi:putative oxidoreductase
MVCFPVLYNQCVVATRRQKGRTSLQRLFSTFPSGWPGVGLLLLRIAAGATACVQGLLYLSGGEALSVTTLIGLLALAGGSAMILGFLTPIAGGLVGLGTIALQLWRMPAPPGSLLHPALPAIIIAIVAVSVVLIGPGAMSIDARLFGRREIIVRQSPKPGSGPSTSIEG